MKKQILIKIFSGIMVSTLCLEGVSVQRLPFVFAESTIQTDAAELMNELAKAKQIDTSNSTDESAAFLQAVISLIEEESGSNPQQLPVDKYTVLLKAAENALVPKKTEGIIYDGTYQIEGVLRHASSDQDSMGNAAIVKPMELIVEGEEAFLRMEFVPLTTNLGTTKFTGYLSSFTYFPGWTGGESGYALPSNQTPVEVEVESYYEDTYDIYNHPENGKDSNVKGKLYPHYVILPVDLKNSELWVQVYVPVMEAISTGSGKQYAKLQLDWNTLQQTKGADTEKTVLTKAGITAKEQLEKLEQSQEASASQLTLLQAAVAAVEAAKEDVNITQEQINAVVKAVQSASGLFQTETSIEEEKNTIEKSGLHTMLLAATSIVGRDGYTSTTIKALKKAIQTAEAVYMDGAATQEEVNQQTSALAAAIINLELKKSGSSSQIVVTTAPAVTATASPTPTVTEGATLDIRNLKDGTYTMNGTMVKIDKAEASMANEAINHTIKLTVKKGKYTVTLNFAGLSINAQQGYLGKLSYFKEGYTLDQYGAPSGKTGKVTVNTYQTQADGSRVKDNFGTDYPKQVTFPLIKEALEDGYVPLQVFVPIMESISQGTGTQPVYLKLDLKSLQAVTKGEDVFNQNAATPTPTLSVTATPAVTGSLWNSLSTLPSSKRVTASPTPKAGNITGSGKSISGQTKKANSTIQNDKTSTWSNAAQGTVKINEDTASLQAEAAQQTETNLQTQSAVEEQESQEEKTKKAKNAIPSVMSLLVVAAGIFYKCKSLNVFSCGRKKR